MKKQKLKLDDINVESLNSFELIKNEDLSMFAGGSGSGTYSWDCVFNCFDYLDNGVMDGYMSGSNSYYWNTVYNLGYDPAQNGGVRMSDVCTVGGYGGLTVTDLGSGGFGITGSGTTATGQRIMMVMSAGAGGLGHAVVVTSVQVNGSGVPEIYYYDPSSRTTGKVQNGQYAGFYAVSH